MLYVPLEMTFFQANATARVVNQMLSVMDGVEARGQVFILGATNRPGHSLEGCCLFSRVSMLCMFMSSPLPPLVSLFRCIQDMIDPAVLRPGRFGKKLYVGLPSVEDREAILATITKVN